MDFQTLVQALRLPESQTSLAQNPQLNPELIGVSAIDQAQAKTIAFLEGKAWSKPLQAQPPSVLIVRPHPDLLAEVTAQGMAWIATEHPRLLFAQAVGLFYQPWQPHPGIHSTAVIDPSAQLGVGVSIGAHAVIQGGVVLGDGVCVHANATLYPEVQIGDRTILHAHSVIHERSIIGPDCMIHSGAVIGSEGFGFVPTAGGWVKMPQSGRVVLEAGVEVGCNTTIDRPSVGETRIGEGTKIDNLVQVGHGCQIGRHCVLVSQVGLAGAVQLGDRVVIAGQAGISEKINIGAGAIITAKAGVIQDIGPGETVSGHPAMPHKLWLRTSLLLRRLPELLRKPPIL